MVEFNAIVRLKVNGVSMVYIMDCIMGSACITLSQGCKIL